VGVSIDFEKLKREAETSKTILLNLYGISKKISRTWNE
jgi:hypothetical protein